MLLASSAGAVTIDIVNYSYRNIVVTKSQAACGSTDVTLAGVASIAIKNGLNHKIEYKIESGQSCGNSYVYLLSVSDGAGGLINNVKITELYDKSTNSNSVKVENLGPGPIAARVANCGTGWWADDGLFKCLNSYSPPLARSNDVGYIQLVF
jgi:hypothetical protein